MVRLNSSPEWFAWMVGWFAWMVSLDGSPYTTVSAYTTVRTDNGGEFVGAPFQKELTDRNVHLEAAPPYKHVHLVERTNRTVKDATRALMFAENIRATFLREAVSTAVYTKNRLVDSRGARLTPYKRFFSYPPTIDHLRTFGCSVYAMRAKCSPNVLSYDLSSVVQTVKLVPVYLSICCDV
jgi:hypothetical protein